MTRPLRIEYDGAWYHVMNRGLERRAIVRDDKDKRRFFEVLGETAKTYQIEIHAYSLLANHYHLLIHTPHCGLSRSMRHLNGVYTRRFNRRHRRDGPLFRGRYKSKVVEEDEYLLELVRYIHLNAVESGVCKSPEKHAWTSHRAYLNDRVRPDWLVTSKVLACFAKERKRARQEMDKFVKARIPKRIQEDIKRPGIYLGGKGFGEWLYENFVDKTQKKEGISKKDLNNRTRVRVVEIMKIVSHCYGITGKELREGCHGRKNEGRSMAVYLARELTGLAQKEIARWFNAKSGYTIAKMQQRIKQRMERERSLRRQYNELFHSIMSNVKP